MQNTRFTISISSILGAYYSLAQITLELVWKQLHRQQLIAQWSSYCSSDTSPRLGRRRLFSTILSKIILCIITAQSELNTGWSADIIAGVLNLFSVNELITFSLTSYTIQANIIS